MKPTITIILLCIRLVTWGQSYRIEASRYKEYPEGEWVHTQIKDAHRMVILDLENHALSFLSFHYKIDSIEIHPNGFQFSATPRTGIPEKMFFDTVSLNLMIYHRTVLPPFAISLIINIDLKENLPNALAQWEKQEIVDKSGSGTGIYEMISKIPCEYPNSIITLHHHTKNKIFIIHPSNRLMKKEIPREAAHTISISRQNSKSNVSLSCRIKPTGEVVFSGQNYQKLMAFVEKPGNYEVVITYPFNTGYCLFFWNK